MANNSNQSKKQNNYRAEVYQTLPWSFTNFGDQSEIEAFIPALGKWETIADVHSVGNIDAEDIAEIIVEAVNSRIDNDDRKVSLEDSKSRGHK